MWAELITSITGGFEMGLFDFLNTTANGGQMGASWDDPRTQGILAAAAGLLQAGGPNRQRVGLGQAIGQGLLTGMDAYQGAKSNQAMSKFRDLQLKQAEQQAADQAAAREWMNPVARFGQQNGSLAPTQQNAAAFHSQPQLSPQNRIMQMAMSGNPVLMAQAKAMRDSLPKVKDYNKVMVDGQAVYQPMYEDGSMGTPGNNQAAERLAFQNLGGHTVALNPFSGQQVAGFGNTLSPDAAASNSLGWANNSVSRQRLSFDQQQAGKPQFKDGYWVTPPQAGQMTGQVIATPIAAPAKGSPLATQQASAKVIPLLDKADFLLNDSTGSYLGTWTDMMAQGVGGSTKGARAASQLKALEGSIMMAQPRMEGPQSDKDAALYRQMAGQIGDSTVPVETRRAALQTIRQLHSMYTGGNPAAASQPAGGAKFLGFE